ncbi:MAG: neutral/alkaline non-lysosomal ceramidase N-terminal domain-containing protein [Clostridia bacterium]|nr:neutral/alkaline non-lysosomal ceramidase N-terminal domain-containing protein [Clostridia bacterium]
MLLGVAKEIITPEIGACLYGYRPDFHSASVEDDLTAIAFYFEEGHTRALWFSLAVCLIETALSDSIRHRLSEEFGVPFENIMLSATHTHSGPNTAGAYGWGDIDRAYCDGIFIPAILKAAKAAMSAPVEVEMGIGTGNSHIGINRREICEDGTRVNLGQNPWGCYNPQMTVIAFRDREKKPIANLVHYGMHGTCAGQSDAISRDWSGVMCDTLEKASGALTAFVTGPEGDVGPRLSNGKTVGCGDISYVYEIGHRAALDAVNIYKGIRMYHSVIRFAVAERTMTIPLAPRFTEAFAKDALVALEGKTVNIQGAKRLCLERVLESYHNGYEERESITVPHNFLLVDDVAVVSFPYELFSEMGLRIAKFSPFAHTLSLSCTNGSESYFVTETDICRGGYEVSSFLYRDIQSMVLDADRYLVSQTLDNLRGLYANRESEK